MGHFFLFQIHKNPITQLIHGYYSCDKPLKLFGYLVDCVMADMIILLYDVLNSRQEKKRNP